MNKDAGRWARSLGLFAVVVTDLVGYSAAGLAIGYFMWKKWNAPWWVLLLTSLTGLGMGFHRVYLFSEKMENETNDQNQSKSQDDKE